MGGLNFKEGIVQYYIFQKKLSNYLNKINNDKDKFVIKDGYIIHPDWIDCWRKLINYPEIEKFFDGIDLNKTNLLTNKEIITEYLQNNISEEEITLFLSQNVNTDYFDIIQHKTLDKNFLINMLTEDIFKALRIDEKNSKVSVKYIFKQKMVIFGIEDYLMIKIIITDTTPYINNEKIINLTWNFYNLEEYNNQLNFFKNNNSQNILDYFITKEIFTTPIITVRNNDNNNLNYNLINDDLIQNNQNSNEIIYNYQMIKKPEEINFNLIQRISFRGLDNVGDKYNMNPVIQCLANIKSVTEYLLNPKKYSEIFNNQSICPLTIQYCQVLLGLFCDNSNDGSYFPLQFRNTLNKMIHSSQGNETKDSKDLNIFLLEKLNSELSKLHNKNRNIIKNKSEIFKVINTNNEKEVLNEFIKNFKFSHSSVISVHLYGFQKNIIFCKYCSYATYNFNSFNTLTFNLLDTANYFNLNNNNNNNMIPIITFDHCFNYLLKEQFQQNICQNCKKTGNIIYKENLYLLPNYLIIILNRGKENVFDCKVDIQEIFDSSNYEENVKNKKYELIGVISYFGQNNNEQHSIAFCKHYIDNKWRCYNDNVVTICQGDYLQKGIPYILFYKKMNDLKEDNNNMAFNNQNFNQNINMNCNNVNNFQQGFNMENNFQGNMDFNFNNGNMNQNMNFDNNNFQNNMNMDNIGFNNNNN